MNYGSDAVEFIGRHNAEFILALCVAQLLIFVALLSSFIRARRLRTRVDKLTELVAKLSSDEATRYTKSILARAKDPDSR